MQKELGVYSLHEIIGIPGVQPFRMVQEDIPGHGDVRCRENEHNNYRRKHHHSSPPSLPKKNSGTHHEEHNMHT
jgi:hypothetical protein